MATADLHDRFLDEARDRARLHLPDDDGSLSLLPVGLPWKTILVLLLLAWYAGG